MVRAAYHVPREAKIIDKIKQPVGYLTGNKKPKREGEGTNARPCLRRGEGCEAHGQRKNPKLTQCSTRQREECTMSIATLIIPIAVLFPVLGGGYYWTRRWSKGRCT